MAEPWSQASAKSIDDLLQKKRRKSLSRMSSSALVSGQQGDSLQTLSSLSWNSANSVSLQSSKLVKVTFEDASVDEVAHALCAGDFAAFSKIKPREFIDQVRFVVRHLQSCIYFNSCFRHGLDDQSRLRTSRR